MSLFSLAGPGLILNFDDTEGSLKLVQMQREDGEPLLVGDTGETVGNPLTVVVPGGPYAGIYGGETFHIMHLAHSEQHLLAYLEHPALPLLVALEIRVEGNVATWRGQVCWNGDSPLEADIYFPMLSRVCFESPQTDRALFSAISGTVIGPTGTAEYQNGYLGGLSSPTFLVEGGGRGLAFLDDNRADFAADPGACVRRTYVLGNSGLLRLPEGTPHPTTSEEKAPSISVCHTRVFRSTQEVGLTDADMAAELRPGEALPMEYRGDTIDLGPIHCYAYQGTWKTGALWLREKRQQMPLRTPPALWYRQTTFLSEDMGDDMLRRGQSFYDYPLLLAEKEKMGSQFFHLPGFHDPEILGQSRNWLNRGDYVFAAQNLGGLEGVRRGVDAVHRGGGHILYYVEGLIMWKRSRIGRSKGREWALIKEDGSYDEHYKGFWHMCPSHLPWCDWLAQTCAEIVRSTGIDGFFIDSTAATDFHRCFNPAHNHPHPDVWNWGVRQMLRRVREAVDQVNPETILIVEGAADIAREYADGSLAHSHQWSKNRFGVPLLRFLSPEMRVFESWGEEPRNGARCPEANHIWNCVHGHRIYAHSSAATRMQTLSAHTRRYYDAFPEICDSALSARDIETQHCIAELFEALPPVITVGNMVGESVRAELKLPLPGGILFDRVDSLRVPIRCGIASLPLKPYEFRAFEVRA